jgi:hypothetical protein
LVIESFNLERDELVVEDGRLVIFSNSPEFGESGARLAASCKQFSPLGK